MAFTRISDTPEGVAALRKLAADLRQAHEDLSGSIDEARSTAEENRDGLGSYAAKCEDLLDEIQAELASAIVPLVSMGTSLTTLAAELEEYINSNGGGSGN